MATRDGLPHLSRDDVIARLRASGCHDVMPYAALLQQSIWMRVDPSRPPGLMDSRFGGPAMMPDDFEWPTYTAEPFVGRDPDDDPDTFVLWYARQQKLPTFLVAQLNLAELPIASALPREGMLSLFTDPFDGVWGHSKSDRHGLRVIYTPPEAFGTLRPHEMPERSDHPGAFADFAWPEYRIEYFVKWTFSDWDAARRLINDEPDCDAGARIGDTMEEIFGYTFGHFLLDGGCNHQGDPRRSAVMTWNPPANLPEGYIVEQLSEHEREIDRRASTEWTCLFSIPHDNQLRPVVGDTGGLSFLVRKDDLAARQFDRTWIVRT